MSAKINRRNPGPFSQSDLIMSPEGQVYHLAISEKQLSRNILTVGDPDRVSLIAAEFLGTIEHEVFHRGLRTVTGIVKETGQRVSLVTSGMGTPSLEIVLSELMLLNEIDPTTRTRREEIKPLTLIRVGTSGALHDSTLLGSSIISSYAVGLDNTGLFYDIPPADAQCVEIESRVKQMLDEVMERSARFYGKIYPYVAKADEQVLQALTSSAHALGIPHDVGVTVASSGFHGNQGRDVARIAPSVPDIDLHLSKLLLPGGLRVLNMEMESSHLFHYAGGLGYRAGTVCVAVANRRTETFAKNALEGVLNAVRLVLKSFTQLGE
jgi:uridine phosphorylase